MNSSAFFPVSKTFNALSGDVQWLSQLMQGEGYGRIHSVFERVVNLEQEGALFTLAGRSCDNAPNTLIVDILSFDSTYFHQGDRWQALRGEGLHFASGAIISLHSAQGWQACLPRYYDVPAENISLLAQAVQHHWHSEKPALHAPGYEKIVRETLKNRTDALMAACFEKDSAAVIELATHIIGLGPGLTPAGDDFLLGLFTVINLEGSPCGYLKAVVKIITARARAQTNLISFTALQQVSKGRVRAVISELLLDAMQSAPQRLEKSIDKVLSIGSSSGADILSGILAGLKLCKAVLAYR